MVLLILYEKDYCFQSRATYLGTYSTWIKKKIVQFESFYKVGFVDLITYIIITLYLHLRHLMIPFQFILFNFIHCTLSMYNHLLKWNKLNVNNNFLFIFTYIIDIFSLDILYDGGKKKLPRNLKKNTLYFLYVYSEEKKRWILKPKWNS